MGRNRRRRGAASRVWPGRPGAELIGAGGFSARVVLAQLRSASVDLLQATGMTRDDALAVLPVLSRRARSARGTNYVQRS